MGVSCPCTAVEQGHVVLAGLVLCPGSVCVAEGSREVWWGGGEATSIHAKAQARSDLVRGARFLVSRDK